MCRILYLEKSKAFEITAIEVLTNLQCVCVFWEMILSYKFCLFCLEKPWTLKKTADLQFFTDSNR